MTKALFKLFILFITCSTAISCSEQDSPELPDNSGNTNQGIASIDQTQINANGGGFIIRVKADGTWQASSSETWCTLSRTSGNGNGSISGYMKANTGAERSVIITITAGKEEAKFTLKQLAGNGSNPVPDPEKPSGYASMLEIPALKGGSMNQFITHTTKRNGKDYPTYSLEYSYKYKHSYWIAYRFDNTTGGNVGRNEAYKPDPELPSQYAAKHNDYTNSGYTRGHLCASSDRQYSKEANQQTFYMSNISPQSGNGFNQSGSAWNTGEDKVQAWGYNISRSTDTLYVVKGGTIGEGMIKGYIKNEIAIPKYFFMPFTRECMIFGTTEAIITSSITSVDNCLILSQSHRNTPYSSDVLDIPVVILKVFSRRSPSNSPIVIFVFPASIANIMPLFPS